MPVCIRRPYNQRRGIVSEDLRQQYPINGYSRVSAKAALPDPRFTPSNINDARFEFRISVMEPEIEPVETSRLLELESLPKLSNKFTANGVAARRTGKHKSESEREELAKLLKIVAGYALTFFVLLSITYYLVYFR
ncbi:hypothetical protein QAD02_008738 [Eretmocerus hayati]|uniref:Uncharacterized protein n=1 Tax=Eretmocerus hayati TaxID=131215 RepID=A0ACC2N8Q6_9HYME|nr:hypothetical protein QAD02_008738 [Eretmocerus hayati]